MTTQRNRSAAPRRAENGTWWFVVDGGAGFDAKGVWRERRQVKRRGFATKAAAQAALDEVRRTARAGEFVPRQEQRLDAFLAEWLEAVRPSLAASTHESYARMIRVHVLPRIGHLRLRQIDAGTLNAMYAKLLESGNQRGKKSGGLSPKTVGYAHTIIRKALDAAVKWGRLTRNPAALADPPSWKASKAAGRAVIRAWTPAELSRFLTAESDDPGFALWMFLATTGCRRGEALGLRWRDLDLDAGTAAFRQTIGVVGGQPVVRATTKTGRTRMIELDQEQTVPVLRQLRTQQAAQRLLLGPGYIDTDLVFAGPTGAIPHPAAISKRFDRRVARLDVPRIRLHDLRHTWATLALAAGVHPKIVQERLGHSSTAITLDIYSHATPAQRSDAAATVAGLIFGSGA